MLPATQAGFDPTQHPTQNPPRLTASHLPRRQAGIDAYQPPANHARNVGTSPALHFAVQGDQSRKPLHPHGEGVAEPLLGAIKSILQPPIARNLQDTQNPIGPFAPAASYVCLPSPYPHVLAV